MKILLRSEYLDKWKTLLVEKKITIFFFVAVRQWLSSVVKVVSQTKWEKMAQSLSFSLESVDYLVEAQPWSHRWCRGEGSWRPARRGCPGSGGGWQTPCTFSPPCPQCWCQHLQYTCLNNKGRIRQILGRQQFFQNKIPKILLRNLFHEILDPFL